jgi:hypothetical protein
VKRADWLFVVLLLLLAHGLRITGISFAQPTGRDSLYPMLHSNTPLHPDEYFYVAIPLEMLLQERVNPRFFENPSFLIYAQYATFALTGAHQQPGLSADYTDGLTIRSLAPFHLYVIGRVYSALGGLLAVACGYALARLLAGRSAGILTGLLLAVSFPLVQHAHYATTSSLAAGFAMLSLWAGVVALRSKPQQAYLWLALSAFAAGLAIGNRYNVAPIGFSVLLIGILLLWPGRVLRWRVLLAWLALPLAFLLTTPFALLDFPEFWRQFSLIFTRYTQLGAQAYPTINGLWIEYRYVLLFGLGVPAALLIPLALWGLIRVHWVMLAILLYVVPYSAVVLDTPRAHTGDQLTVPLIPVLALLVGVGYAVLLRWLPMLRRINVLLIVGCCAVPLALTVPLVSLFAQQDTRYHMQTWLYANIPQGATMHLLGAYNVPLEPLRYQVQQTFDIRAASAQDLADADYVLLSDARLFEFMRRDSVPDKDKAALQAEISALTADWPILAQIERPRPPGYDWMPNNATYWHHPSLTLYCAAACDAP